MKGNSLGYVVNREYDVVTSPITNPMTPSLRLASLNRTAKEVWRRLRQVSAVIPVSEYFVLPADSSGRTARVRLQHLVSHIIGLLQQAEQANVDFNNRYLEVMRNVLVEWYVDYVIQAGQIAADVTGNLPASIRSSTQIEERVNDLLRYIANRHIGRMVPFGQVTRFFELIHAINTLRTVGSADHPNIFLTRLFNGSTENTPLIFRLYHIINSIDIAFEQLGQNETAELSLLLSALSQLSDHMASGRGSITLNLGQGRYVEIDEELVNLLRALYTATTVYAAYDMSCSLALKHLFVEAADDRPDNPWAVFSVMHRLESSQVVESADLMVWHEDTTVNTTSLSDSEMTDALFGLALGVAMTAMISSYGPESVVLIRPLANDFFSTIDAYLSRPDFLTATPLVSMDLVKRYLPSEWNHAEIGRDLRHRLAEINRHTLVASQSANATMAFADQQLGVMMREGLFHDIIKLTALGAIWHVAAIYRGRKANDDKIWRAIAASSIRVDAIGPSQAMTDVARVAIMAARHVCEAVLSVIPRLISAYERVFKSREELPITEIILRNIAGQLISNPDIFLINLNYQRQTPKEIDFLKGRTKLTELLTMQPELASGVDEAIDIIVRESEAAKLPQLRMSTDTYYTLARSVMRVTYNSDYLQIDHHRLVIIYPDDTLRHLLRLPVYTSHVSALHLLRQWLTNLRQEGLAKDISDITRRQYVFRFRKVSPPAAFPKELVALMRHIPLTSLVSALRARLHHDPDGHWLQDLLDQLRREERIVHVTRRQLLAKLGLHDRNELSDLLALWGISLDNVQSTSLWLELFKGTVSWLLQSDGGDGPAQTAELAAFIESDPFVGVDVAYVDDVMTLGNGYVVDPLSLRTVRCPDIIGFVVQSYRPSQLRLKLSDRIGQALSEALVPELTSGGGLVSVPSKSGAERTADEVSAKIKQVKPKPDIIRDRNDIEGFSDVSTYYDDEADTDEDSVSSD
jgi:hypothetical protein